MCSDAMVTNKVNKQENDTGDASEPAAQLGLSQVSGAAYEPSSAMVTQGESCRPPAARQGGISTG